MINYKKGNMITWLHRIEFIQSVNNTRTGISIGLIVELHPNRPIFTHTTYPSEGDKIYTNVFCEEDDHEI
jgi:hypothetical protein